MAQESEDVLLSLRLSEADSKVYKKETEVFDKHFVPRRNVIYERACFNQRRQMEHESVEDFVTDLHRLADTCEFGTLKMELIRDRLVVGLLDKAVSLKLQMDRDLTLDSAVSRARNAQPVKSQQKVVHADTGGAPEAPVVAELRQLKRKGAGDRKPMKDSLRDLARKHGTPCRWCGQTLQHQRTACPAYGKQCASCRKIGHFSVVCMSADKRRHKTTRNTSDAARHTMELYLREVSATPKDAPWVIAARVNDELVNFKVDTGADITAIPSAVYDRRTMGPIKKTSPRLYGPGRTPINTTGEIETVISWNEAPSVQRVFLVDGFQNPLLGRPAIQALGVLAHLEEIQAECTLDRIAAKFLSLFSPLGQMKTSCTIKLAPRSTPYALACPRHVPLLLLPRVQDELGRMEGLGVTVKVDSATEWCALMVVVKKSDSQLRICVDYGELDKQILSERLIISTVEENLAKIGGATIFSKLDANSGYWQAPLTPES
ncbi:uncharacterized protein LOC135394473 [Ornithodoros turicata]|uniref:uncharacterized protein LOC135394473 n=1 Tax=Ornithodoros turicata TaxID=34597 RepID=UPI003139A7F7